MKSYYELVITYQTKSELDGCVQERQMHIDRSKKYTRRGAQRVLNKILREDGFEGTVIDQKIVGYT